MKINVHHRNYLRGDLSVPGDKSLGHRALILGAVADGRQIVRGLPTGGDVNSTRRCLETLGVGFVDEPGGGLRVVPPAAFVRDAHLDCGNSGTTARFLMGLLAGLGVPAVLDGDASLRRRPMRRVSEPLAALGARITTGDDGGLPARIEVPATPLGGSRVVLPVASAQVKSAVLLAGLFAEGETTVVSPAASRDHTERLLAVMGAEIRQRRLAVTVTGRPGGRPNLRGLDLALPGDLSTAAFLVAAGVLVPDAVLILRRVGVNPTRAGILDALAGMGARIAAVPQGHTGGEPVSDIHALTSRLRGTVIEGDLVPLLIDELPVLAVAATQAHGETVVRDAAELRHKESDRIHATVTQLRRLGADIRELDDGFVVNGPTLMRGCEVDAGGDHRLAMALAVAGLIAAGVTTVAGAESAAVSHPGFWDDLDRIGGPGTIRKQEAAA